MNGQEWLSVRPAKYQERKPRRGTLTTMVGSWIQLRLPEEYDRLFVNGILIDPGTGTPMEMDGYSAYLTLRALEIKTGDDFEKERRGILEAVMRRLNETEPPFSHGEFTGSVQEVHMRMTAAAVRLIVEAVKDGLLPNSDALIRASRYLFSFSERLNKGCWFLHDSLELAATGIPYPGKRILNNAWGSSTENNLVLNTHLDTLTTGIYILPFLPQGDANYLSNKIKEGIVALHMVLNDSPKIWRLFSSIESVVRTTLFITFRSNTQLARYIRGLIRLTCFGVRARLRSRWPLYVMADGYLERDVSLFGTSYEYHLVNVYDLIRLAYQLRTSDFHNHTDLINKCEAIAERGIDYAIRSTYWDYLIWSSKRERRAVVLLCEAIISLLAYLKDDEVPQSWLHVYCHLRHRVAPSSALLGYDPIIGRMGTEIPMIADDQEVVTLLDGRRLRIRMSSGKHEWL